MYTFNRKHRAGTTYLSDRITAGPRTHRGLSIMPENTSVRNVWGKKKKKKKTGKFRNENSLPLRSEDTTTRNGRDPDVWATAAKVFTWSNHKRPATNEQTDTNVWLKVERQYETDNTEYASYHIVMWYYLLPMMGMMRYTEELSPGQWLPKNVPKSMFAVTPSSSSFRHCDVCECGCLCVCWCAHFLLKLFPLNQN